MMKCVRTNLIVAHFWEIDPLVLLLPSAKIIFACNYRVNLGGVR
jgi:hypothetical protein